MAELIIDGPVILAAAVALGFPVVVVVGVYALRWAISRRNPDIDSR